MTSEVDLSVVIPALDEERRLPSTLRKIREHLDALPLSFEIVVVDDGSTDRTVEAARAASARIVSNRENRGKGYSVRRGMLEARGRLRLMTDADLSTPIEDLRSLRAAIDEGADIAIGSRAIRASQVQVRQPILREAAGRLFNLFVRALLLPDIRDTQCGFKLFTAKAARTAFEAATHDGFAFDVEVLVAARAQGLRIAEVGVTWRNDAATRVGLRSGMRAFADLAAIRLRAWRGDYSPKAPAVV